MFALQPMWLCRVAGDKHDYWRSQTFLIRRATQQRPVRAPNEAVWRLILYHWVVFKNMNSESAYPIFRTQILFL